MCLQLWLEWKLRIRINAKTQTETLLHAIHCTHTHTHIATHIYPHNTTSSYFTHMQLLHTTTYNTQPHTTAHNHTHNHTQPHTTTHKLQPFLNPVVRSFSVAAVAEEEGRGLPGDSPLSEIRHTNS